MISRATILLMTSQVIFLFSGFLINSGLARIFKPIDYGTFGLVMSILVIVELFVITGIPEAIQKFGGERPEVMSKLISKTLPWQIVYAIIVFLIFWLIAPLLSNIFGDSELTFYLRIAGIDIIIYGLYKYFLGVQNGLHRFFHYTILGITYSLAKLAAILGLVWLGFSISGALVGNIIGSVLALILAFMFSRVPESEVELESRSYTSFVIQNVFYFVGLNLFFSIDLWFVKYYIPGAGVGLYVSASVLAKVTYLISVALSAVLLPSLSRTIKLQQQQRTNALIKDSLRYLMIFLVLINTVIIINSTGIIKLFFGDDYIAAASVLSILIVGLSFFTMMAIINTIMIANNQMRASLVLILGLLILDCILNRILVPHYQLYGAAIATATVGLLGTILGGLYVFKEFKSLIISFSLVRLTAITLFVFFIANLMNQIHIDVILKSVLLGSIFLFLLWLTREITSVDLRRFKESLGFSNT